MGVSGTVITNVGGGVSQKVTRLIGERRLREIDGEIGE
jgi:hypothetical protein